MTRAPWTSVHLFLSDRARADACLAERVRPLVEDWQRAGDVSGWFFIRYWHGGPHLRIRLQGRLAGDPERARAALAHGLDAWASETPPTRNHYYAGHSFDGAAVDATTLPWFDEGSALLIPYEPEWQRYGGADAMAESERLFERSSRLAVAIIAATVANPERRLPAALALMAAAADVVAPDAEARTRFFASYAAFWRGNAPSAAGAPASAMLAAFAPAAIWQREIAAFVDRLRVLAAAGCLLQPWDGQPTGQDVSPAIGAIVASHLHMLNNRLGLPPAVEARLADILAHSRHDRQELAA
ncbi:thiopeptide-type bacteriocin biosynthesis protein [Sandaracinobacteroides saxicola]|uniref:Thiopeptide-type bacteriocin biosynthesis domain-containing protein n=1 Tax=Sandaracinobacteroides saxicola TaxID=2759707 RepID=A0A7G5IIT6_9SPHN|nr:thiopeptide-type bacteriocin biosynthesis protein [Sandaracinobacteroides saxicola]QMW23278.1 hypothetical protein H3309_01840 [Sandaracinobacteroides saxicola]